MGLFHPDLTMVITKAAILQALDKVPEKEARYRCVDDGPRQSKLPGNLEGRGEQFLKLGGLQRIILYGPPARDAAGCG
jgi:hypothetical protein